MSAIRLKIDSERLTLDDLIAIDEGTTTKPRAMRDLLARFAMDESGAFLDADAARKWVGALNVKELRQAIATLEESIKELRANAVNPPTAAV